jgi:hypothetical protein
MFLETFDPYLDRNLHRGAPDFPHPGVARDGVPHSHWLKKGKSLHRHCDNASVCRLRRENSAAQIHLRHEPATEDVTIGIGVPRHGDGANDQLAFGLRLHGASIIGHPGPSRGRARGSFAQGCGGNPEILVIPSEGSRRATFKVTPRDPSTFARDDQNLREEQ